MAGGKCSSMEFTGCVTFVKGGLGCGASTVSFGCCCGNNPVWTNFDNKSDILTGPLGICSKIFSVFVAGGSSELGICSIAAPAAGGPSKLTW